jgi:phosphomannomutase
VAGFSCTGMLEKLCAHYGLEVIRTRIGFNHIADIMLREDILAGGEENGGITIGTYLPERDGIWMGILIWNWLIESGKSLSELLREVEEITGPFAFERIDLTLNKNVRSKILDKCKKGEFTEFGKNLVTEVEELDGVKFFFDTNEWVLVRPSTMSPVIRLYAEAGETSRVRELILSVQHVLQQIN